MNQKHVLVNLIGFKLVVEEIDSLMTSLQNKLIRELTINLESKSSNKLFAAIKWS